MANLQAYQQYRWNDRLYSNACPRISFHYEQNGLMQPAPYYVCVTLVNKQTGEESRMGPLARVYAKRPFSLVFVSVDKVPQAPFEYNVWVSYDNNYYHRVPVLRQVPHTSKQGQRSLTMMVSLLQFTDRVAGYNGRLGGYRGLHNVVLPECGGNGRSVFNTSDNNDGNLMHFTEPGYKWQYPDKLPVPTAY
jgi:hypothetical protein